MAQDIIVNITFYPGDPALADLAAVADGDIESIDLEGVDRRTGTPVTVRVRQAQD
ncbi:hypothetical protein [Mycolicibacterium sp.]|uniref:hypothetical protein n=1 Tax=Mycolicibacterium sp. TaxID=2320850 RepID=UPI00355D1C84